MRDEILELIADGEKDLGQHKGETLQSHLNYLCKRHGLPTVLEILVDLAGEQISLADKKPQLKKLWFDLHNTLAETVAISCQIEQNGGEIK